MSAGTVWGRSRYALDAATLAQRLLGHRLVRVLPTGERLAGIIVETEAYTGPEDQASHARNTHRSPRNESMYARPGTAYVYLTYGMHHCFNIACEREGHPGAVLIRAIEPVEGVETMRRLRADARNSSRPVRDREIASGPGRLCAALAIDRALDGADMTGPAEVFVETAHKSGGAPFEVLNTPRIGVDSAGEWAGAPLRWVALGSAYASRAPTIRPRELSARGRFGR